jgi:hypothetical protein
MRSSVTWGQNPEMKIALVLDCSNPEALATFWTQALHYQRAGKMGPYVILLPDGWEAPEILLQHVPEPKIGKNRMHLDIRSPDITLESLRLISLGATAITESPIEEDGVRWLVMRDPDGNEFCMVEDSDA